MNNVRINVVQYTIEFASWTVQMVWCLAISARAKKFLEEYPAVKRVQENNLTDEEIEEYKKVLTEL